MYIFCSVVLHSSDDGIRIQWHMDIAHARLLRGFLNVGYCSGLRVTFFLKVIWPKPQSYFIINQGTLTASCALHANNHDVILNDVILSARTYSKS